MLVWRVVAKYLKKLEESRIEFSLQIYDKTSKTLDRIRIQYP